MRRAKGEGSIFQQADGRWVGKLDLGRDPRTGNRRRRKVTAATKREAARRLTELRDQRDAGTIALDRPSVGDLTARWLERVAVRKTDSTRMMYEHLAAKHLDAHRFELTNSRSVTSRTGSTLAPI